MKVTSVQIRSVLGVTERLLKCGKVTAVRGRNASGKSSILAAIQSALGGGSLAKLATVGGEDPEVVLVLDDGAFRVEKDGGGVRVRARVGKSAAYEEVKRPQGWLDGLFDPLLANPVRFLQAKPDERAELLLEALPLELDRDALADAIGADGIAAAGDLLRAPGHALSVLGAIREAIFTERTGVNVSAKDKAASAYELQKALPAEMPEDPGGTIAAAEKRRDELAEVVTQRTAVAESAFKQWRTAAQHRHDQQKASAESEFKTRAAKIRTKLAQDIAALERQAEAEIEDVRQAAERVIDSSERALAAEQEGAINDRTRALEELREFAAELERAKARVAEIRATSDELTRLYETRRLATKFEAEADSLTGRSERLSRSLERLDAFKRALAKDLPIEGLEVDGKEIKVNGVPFDQVNTALRIRVAVQVATLRARGKDLKVLFVDGAEALDEENFELLVRELEASGIQAFVTAVAESELEIESIA